MCNETYAAALEQVDAHFSVGFLTALVSDELVACEEVLASRGWIEEAAPAALEDAGIARWTKTINGRRIVAYSMAIGKMGQATSAIETITFLNRCKPNLVFLTGIAGSLKDSNVHKADVVVSLCTRWRGQNKVFGAGACDEYRPHNICVNSLNNDTGRVIQKFVQKKYERHNRTPKFSGAWNVHCGEIYTWDYVINSSRIVSKINEEFPEAICVEMEGGGFLAGVERFSDLHGKRPIRAFIVRGISDYASHKDKDKNIRAIASKNAATVAVDLADWALHRENLPSVLAG